MRITGSPTLAWAGLNCWRSTRLLATGSRGALSTLMKRVVALADSRSPALPGAVAPAWSWCDNRP